MNLELDHFFILVEPEARVADILVSMGMKEGAQNIHKGQGTSNRRFYFSNVMLEFLWVHDEDEATNGPARELRFLERSNNLLASPFGLIMHRKDDSNLVMPFDGWDYQPDYFVPPKAFHIGSNSINLLEPLCIYVPFIGPKMASEKADDGEFSVISKIQVYTPVETVSDVLKITGSADRLYITHGPEHLIELTFDNQKKGYTSDLRPDIPLIIHW